MSTPPPENNETLMKTMGLWAVVLSDFVGLTGAGVAIGYFLWKKAGFPAWTVAPFSLAGLGFASYRLYVRSKKLDL